jgi:L-rhamnose-H+ transport protein
MNTWIGILLVTLAGLGTGTIAWPMKLMRHLRFEQYWFLGMAAALVVVPWTVVLLTVPSPAEVYAQVGWKPILLCNFFSLSWGIANVLYGICVLRIGAALTGAILSGLGVACGVTLPMVLKGSGVFQNAPDLVSPAGLTILLGVLVILAGVSLSTLAGFGREKVQTEKTAVSARTVGGFFPGLLMAAAAGVLSCGLSLGFVYTQDPIVAAVKARGGGDIPASMAVWAVGLLGGAFVNLAYPAWLMSKNQGWASLTKYPRDAVLGLVLGLQFIFAVVLMGQGMLLLGVAGAAIGFGIQQALQLLGNQIVGFLSGEWHGIRGKPLRFMLAAIFVLLLAVGVLAWAKRLA